MKRLFFIVVVCYLLTFTPIYKQYAPGYYKKIKSYVHSLINFDEKPSVVPNSSLPVLRRTTYDDVVKQADTDRVADEYNYGKVPSTIGSSSGSSGRKY